MARAASLFPAASGGLPAGLKAAFEAFWKAYPARTPNPRAKAEARFAVACRAARPDDLVRAAGAFAAECAQQKIEGPFVPHAATWLSEQRFLDYPPFGATATAVPAGQAEPDHEWWPTFRGRVGAADFRVWIEPLSVPAHTEGETALVEAPSKFRADHVRQHYASLIARALRVKRVEFTWPGHGEP